jgi:hypothetical protein
MKINVFEFDLDRNLTVTEMRNEVAGIVTWLRDSYSQLNGASLFLIPSLPAKTTFRELISIAVHEKELSLVIHQLRDTLFARARAQPLYKTINNSARPLPSSCPC